MINNELINFDFEDFKIIDDLNKLYEIKQNLQRVIEKRERLEYFNNIGLICVFPNEGKNIPHFHITNKQNSIDICVEIKNAAFFKHGHKHIGELNKKECKHLYNYLNKDNKYWWIELIKLWNKNNNDTLDFTIDIPKYFNIK